MKKTVPLFLMIALALTLAAWGAAAFGAPKEPAVRKDAPKLILAAGETVGRPISDASGLPGTLIPMRDWTEGIALLVEAEDAAFYGLPDGPALLRWGDMSAAFDWLYATPQAVAPKLWLTDADGDGAEELLVRCYGGSGTGVSLDFLYVVEKIADGLVSREFPFDALAAEVNGRLELVTADGVVYAALGRELVDITGELPDDVLPRAIRLGVGQAANYIRTEEGLTATFGIRTEVGAKALPGPYAAKVQANIFYQADGTFAVTDLHLLSN